MSVESLKHRRLLPTVHPVEYCTPSRRQEIGIRYGSFTSARRSGSPFLDPSSRNAVSPAFNPSAKKGPEWLWKLFAPSRRAFSSDVCVVPCASFVSHHPRICCKSQVGLMRLAIKAGRSAAAGIRSVFGAGSGREIHRVRIYVNSGFNSSLREVFPNSSLPGEIPQNCEVYRGH